MIKVGDIITFPRECGFVAHYGFNDNITEKIIWFNKSYKGKITKKFDNNLWIVDIQTGDKYDGVRGLVHGDLLEQIVNDPQ